MPHHKSAEKRLRTNEKARRRNLAIKSALRKQLKKQRATEGTEATAELPTTASQIDRAVGKGVIPKARANRLKSRLARRAVRSPSA
jgi:small subunit ribosomal protein S20